MDTTTNNTISYFKSEINIDYLMTDYGRERYQKTQEILSKFYDLFQVELDSAIIEQLITKSHNTDLSAHWALLAIQENNMDKRPGEPLELTEQFQPEVIQEMLNESMIEQTCNDPLYLLLIDNVEVYPPSRHGPSNQAILPTFQLLNIFAEDPQLSQDILRAIKENTNIDIDITPKFIQELGKQYTQVYMSLNDIGPN